MKTLVCPVAVILSASIGLSAVAQSAGDGSAGAEAVCWQSEACVLENVRVGRHYEVIGQRGDSIDCLANPCGCILELKWIHEWEECPVANGLTWVAKAPLICGAGYEWIQNDNSRIEIEFNLVANRPIRLSQRNNSSGLAIDCRGDIGSFQVARNDFYGIDDWRSSLELPSGAYQIRIVASGLGRRERGLALPNEIVLDLAPIEPVTVPRDFAAIQAALDAAAPNSLIMVSEGTYNEAIDFKGKAITVKAVGARATTIIDGTGKTTSVVRAVTGETSATVLQGFTIRNGTSGTLVNDLRVGGGMVVQNARPTIRDCAFVSNLADAGGGLAAINSHLVIDGCTFSTNTAGTGGGLWLDNGLPNVTNCVISDNTAAGHGGGLYATPMPGQLPNALLSGNTVCGNASDDAGRTNVWALVDDSGNAICDCFGDVDSNGVSDTADISLTLLFFGGETDPEFIQPDQDMNGTVDTGDVALLLLNFGPCG